MKMTATIISYVLLTWKSKDGHKDWCVCGNCKKVERDCLSCQEVRAISEEKIPCLNKLTLKNVLVGLHESKSALEKEHQVKNRSNFSAYKQFVWWIYRNS